MSNDLLPSSQAAEMIRRVSPEGRARAQRERKKRQQATARIAGRIILAALVILAVASLIQFLVHPLDQIGVVAAIITFAIACAVILLASRARPVGAAGLPQERLDRLPMQTQAWLEGRRPALPHACASLIDSISFRLDELAPQLSTMDAREPAADAVRRLLATDLPALVGGYQAVPASLRSRVGTSGRSADAQLIDGLGVIDGEMRRMSEQLARGSLDELATQGRFLETKYEGSSGLS